jgi:hypothetical protein
LGIKPQEKSRKISKINDLRDSPPCFIARNALLAAKRAGLNKGRAPAKRIFLLSREALKISETIMEINDLHKPILKDQEMERHRETTQNTRKSGCLRVVRVFRG